METVDVPLAKCQFKENPRGLLNEKRVADLMENIGVNGQIEACLGFRLPNGDVLVYEGHGRCQALKLLGKPTVMVTLRDQPPSRAELLRIQASINQSREGFPLGASCRLLAELQKETKESAAEIARQTCYSPSMATKMIAVANGHPCLTEMLDGNGLDLEGSYAITTAASDHGRQQELALAAKGMKRDQVKRLVKPAGKTETKIKTVRLEMPGGYSAIFKGDLDLPTLCEVVQELYKQLRSAERAQHDIVSVQRYLRNSVKGGQS